MPGMVKWRGNAAYFCLFVLLICGASSWTNLFNSELTIYRPRDSQVVTRQFLLSAAIPQHIDSNISVSYSISLDGVVLYQGNRHYHLLESSMFIDPPKAGYAVLTVFHTDLSSKVISSDTVVIFVYDLVCQFVQRIQATMSWAGSYLHKSIPDFRPTRSSYLFVGLGADIIARLSVLQPYQVTVLDMDPAACDILGGVNIVHCVSTKRPMDLAQSLYFDVSIVSLSNLQRIWQEFEGANEVSLEQLYRIIMHMTRSSVWLFVPHSDTVDSNSYWNTHLHDMQRNLHRVHISKELHTNISLSEYNSIGSMEGKLKVPIEEVLSLQRVEIFVQYCETVTTEKASELGALLTPQASTVNNTISSASAPSKLSSVVVSNRTLGNVHVHIHNACILKDGHTVVVFTEPGGVGMSAWDELISFYVQDENNGFQFTPIRIREVPIARNINGTASALTPTAQYLLQEADWVSGLSAVPYSALTGHIVHQVEALLQLLECSHYVHSAYANSSSTSSSEDRRGAQLVRLMFPLLFSGKINDWLTTVISLILQFGAEKCSHTARDDSDFNAFGESFTKSSPFAASSGPNAALRTPAVYMRNHLFNTTADSTGGDFYVIRFRAGAVNEPRRPFQEIPPVELEGARCFDDLLLLGRPNTHVKFFPSGMIGRQFRDYVHARMQVHVRSYCETLCSAAANKTRNNSEHDPPLSCPPVSMECTMHIYREHCPCDTAIISAHNEDAVSYRKLRVTVSIRTTSRIILNLPELIEVMLATGLVHKDWLLNHILGLELLPFEEQVRIYAETDILICVHGAAAINGIFMQPGSVVFEIFNGRFVEFVFVPPLREVEVHYVYTYVRDHTAQTEGCDDVPAKCLQGSIYAAASIDCVRIRTCSVRVDVVDFELVFMQAYYHVLSDKWHSRDEPAASSTKHVESVTTLDAYASEPTKMRKENGVINDATTAEVRAAYIAHAYGKRFREALVAALPLLPNIESSRISPIYLLELGVIYYSLGDHQLAYQYCQRALLSVDPNVWGAEIVIQINACLGSAGAYLDDLSTAGEHVITPFLTAWQLATQLRNKSGDDSSVEGATKDERWGLHSTMMAAPLYSLEYNLLRSYERFGRHAQCVDWHLSTLHLPSLQQGGAYVIAYAIVQWSEARRADIDQLEKQMRLSDALSLPRETTFWDEILRVQEEGKHSIAGASQCLNGLFGNLRGTRSDVEQEASVRVQRVLMSMVNLILQAPVAPGTVPAPLPVGNTSDCRLVLFTQFYVHPDPQKNSDLQEVLQRNLDNPYIATVYLINERVYDFSLFNNASKIIQLISGKRLTFQDAFLLINQHERGSVVILANSDIYFDETLHRLAHCHALDNDKALALLKWTSDRADPARGLRITLRTDTQDAWVFRAPMRNHVVQRADFFLGQPKCDNRMVALLQEAQYKVSNPAFAIHAIELSYKTGLSMYANNESVEGDVSDLLLSDEMYY